MSELQIPTSFCMKMSERMAKVEERVLSIQTNDLVHIREDGKEVRRLVERMANRGTRPTWSVVALITFLTSACVALVSVVLR